MFDLPTKVGILSVGGLIMPLSGKEMVRLYECHGWIVLRQRGSHVRVGKGSDRESMPLHSELKKGMEIKLLKKIGG